jgi:hypothetical protein
MLLYYYYNILEIGADWHGYTVDYRYSRSRSDRRISLVSIDRVVCRHRISAIKVNSRDYRIGTQSDTSSPRDDADVHFVRRALAIIFHAVTVTVNATTTNK